jgi:hypothetical protein
MPATAALGMARSGMALFGGMALVGGMAPSYGVGW